MTTTNSKTELASKRITKANLNQLANSLYGEDASCEHIRSGKRGWYLYKGTKQTIFLGANAMEAFDYLQIQENAVQKPVSEVPVSEVSVTSEETTTAVDTPPVKTETATDTPVQHDTTDVPVTPTILKETTTTIPEAPIKQEATDISTTETENTAIAVSATQDEAKTATPVKDDNPVEAKGKADSIKEVDSVKVDKKAIAKTETQEKSPISPKELLEILLDKFPKAFFREPEKIRPVQKYIHKRIRKELNNEYTKDEISAALALYTQTLDYCKKLMEGGERIDLDGNPCGEISQQHMEDAQKRVLGKMPMRQAKKKIPKVPRVPLPHPQPEQLICGKMEVCVKINDLPADSKTLRNGWEEFIIDTNGYMVKTIVRPRTWKKLQKAAQEYPSWIANIRGKMGSRVKGGFELLMPGVQIFEKNPQRVFQSKDDKAVAEEKTATEETQ